MKEIKNKANIKEKVEKLKDMERKWFKDKVNSSKVVNREY